MLLSNRNPVAQHRRYMPDVLWWLQLASFENVSRKLELVCQLHHASPLWALIECGRADMPSKMHAGRGRIFRGVQRLHVQPAHVAWSSRV